MNLSRNLCVSCKDDTLHRMDRCIHCGTVFAMTPVPDAVPFHNASVERAKLRYKRTANRNRYLLPTRRKNNS